jgi:hypothetical protein
MGLEYLWRRATFYDLEWADTVLKHLGLALFNKVFPEREYVNS